MGLVIYREGYSLTNPQNTAPDIPLREAALMACLLSRSALFVDTATGDAASQGIVEVAGWLGVYPVGFFPATTGQTESPCAKLANLLTEGVKTGPRCAKRGFLHTG